MNSQPYSESEILFAEMELKMKGQTLPLQPRFISIHNSASLELLCTCMYCMFV